MSKADIYHAMFALNTSPTPDQVQNQVVGFLAGVSFALKNPGLALSIEIESQEEWALDMPGELYGPDEMAKILLNTIQRKAG